MNWYKKAKFELPTKLVDQSHDIHVLYKEYMDKYDFPPLIGNLQDIPEGDDEAADKYYNDNIMAIYNDFAEKMGINLDDNSYAKKAILVNIHAGMT